ncbi:MAG: DNA-3-methyladenine glycosylase [Elusimicrobiota bacterium]
MNPPVDSGLEVIQPDYFRRCGLDVARDLIGSYLITKRGGVFCGGRILETEAYLGECDPASHASCGKTERNKAMYSTGGTAYVYGIYGIHFCFNVVCGQAGKAEAVLIRSLEPEFGIEEMKKRRKLNKKSRLTCGPANLVRALAINKKDNNVSLPTEEIFFAFSSLPKRETIKTPRIGISKGKNLKYRFVVKNSLFKKQ